MKMFMIVSAEDNLKRWFPIERIVSISEGANGYWIPTFDESNPYHTPKSNVIVLDGDGSTSVVYSMEEAESVVERLEIVCKLP